MILVTHPLLYVPREVRYILSVHRITGKVFIMAVFGESTPAVQSEHIGEIFQSAIDNRHRYSEKTNTSYTINERIEVSLC